AERADLLEALARHRGFLLHTVKGITDEEAAHRTTVSELCLGGLVKHVAYVEVRWADFIVRGPDALAGTDPAAMENHTRSFRMLPGETLDVLLQEYAAVADGTGELVRGLSSLDVSHPLPAAPWFPPGARWSARRVLLHIVAETAQHAGHADIIREALDGSKTMG
ncbi:MAG TPA: DinB family protein, partial [Acidimicrobiales bacterium]|nr:DinB family protein [Acidimicrobiales bacterium]